MRIMDGRQRAARAATARRGALNMTQQELAGAAGVDPKTIWNLEKRDRWPIARNRSRIEKALGWPEGELERISSEDGDEKPLLSSGLLRDFQREVGEEDTAAVLELLAERRRRKKLALRSRYVRDVGHRVNQELLVGILVLDHDRPGHCRARGDDYHPYGQQPYPRDSRAPCDSRRGPEQNAPGSVHADPPLVMR
jgi:transcriptional regulator with XRE-family HTH domain